MSQRAMPQPNRTTASEKSLSDPGANLNGWGITLAIIGVAVAVILGDQYGSGDLGEVDGFNWLLACVVATPFVVSAAVLVAAGQIIRHLYLSRR